MKKFYITLEVNLLQSSAAGELFGGTSFRYTTESEGATADVSLSKTIKDESTVLKGRYDRLFAGLTAVRMFYINEHNAVVDVF